VREWLERWKWELFLAAILVVVVAVNLSLSPFYLGINNFVNLFHLSIEKAIVVVIMTLVIVNGEIDLSVSAVMAFSACVLATLYDHGVPFGLALVIALLAAIAVGFIQGLFVARMRLPSLAVTLAGLIGIRGAARILLEDRSVTEFPDWFERLGQEPLVWVLPLALIVFFVEIVVVGILLQRSAFGRSLYVIGNNAEVARYSGVNVARVKLTVMTASALAAGVAGLFFAARLGSVRANLAEGFELDIITMVLLGGVSIFGGSGTMIGVGLSILIIFNLRNGLGLANVPSTTQTGVIGALLILSVLVPNLVDRFTSRRRTLTSGPGPPQDEGTPDNPPTGGTRAQGGEATTRDTEPTKEPSIERGNA